MRELAGTGFELSEALLDVLQDCTPDETAAALTWAIRHHAINTEITYGDDGALCWLAQIRLAVDAAEQKLGEYIERDQREAAEAAACGMALHALIATADLVDDQVEARRAA